jgi:hypothetical protein
MGKKEQKDQKDEARVEAVLELLRKQAPLTVKQVSWVQLLSSLQCFRAPWYCIVHLLYWIVILHVHLKVSSMISSSCMYIFLELGFKISVAIIVHRRSSATGLA